MYLNLRNDKLSLKKLLMKDIKTDENGNVLLSKTDEWREDDIWNENFEDMEKSIYSTIE
ncbi:hypothetical protein LGL55_10495 [Clostridium tagluense]|uniref:hypothetical protein n=1 Tax=Clostridium tagluense TaxID=360422 RepID=UPI001CF1892E|nr:hypothetical protein [Clostridium tagluense]MCB2300637.1 hypothetical protein [Clostridium tagluense]MCB2311632.1 hypothetical protein [Clostridium tagluense]MCB2316356.1 hypothetical protein [Clostridium tagluense]MCB2321260.1 hypothetical protein [Clostridium tagluense]MCB2326225.1 hypothetical protein [Clostridium tagluense]